VLFWELKGDIVRGGGGGAVCGSIAGGSSILPQVDRCSLRTRCGS
jgi:hypothetical protein